MPWLPLLPVSARRSLSRAGARARRGALDAFSARRPVLRYLASTRPLSAWLNSATSVQLRRLSSPPSLLLLASSKAATMASNSTPSPSKSALTSWFKLLKKSDSSEHSFSSKNINAKTSSNTSVVNVPAAGGNSANVSDNEEKLEQNIAKDMEKTGSNPNMVLHAPVAVKSRSRKNSHTLSLNIRPSPKSPSVTPTQNQFLSTSPTPSRPFLGFKSRSSHSFRPLSQFLDSSSSGQHNEQSNTVSTSFDSREKLRSHRDSFLQQKHMDSIGDSAIFGCDIETSTNNAYGSIYISADIEDGLPDASSRIHNQEYGKVPLVIVACGSFLKSKGLNVEGIFRLAGSNKRIKQLQIIFSSPPDYGAKINWDGYTVHDAASLLRRYLSSLVEPLIPLEFYDSFRNILIEKPELLQYLKDSDYKSPTTSAPSNIEIKKPDKVSKKLIHAQRRQMLQEYAELFQTLPPIQKRVLFYLLDLLAMFSMKSEFNRMPAKNLAAIFQPSILSHPSHDMNPEEYVINSLVIEFMITYSHRILLNIQNEKKGLKNYVKDPASKKTNINSSANDTIVTQDKNTSISKPTIIQGENHSNDTLSINSRNYMSSPIRSSPLKHMITPLERKNNMLDLGGLDEPPPSPFADRHKLNIRPHSKSVSITPHSEIVRVANASKDSYDSKLTQSDEQLSSSVSNQSEISSIQLIQQKEKSKTKGNQLLSSLEIYPKQAVPSLNLFDQNISLNEDSMFDFPPETPTTQTMLKQEITPTHSTEELNFIRERPTGSILEKEVHNNELCNGSFKSSGSHRDSKSVGTGTNQTESITSSSFSFQPSLLHGHVSRADSNVSSDMIPDNEIEREISKQNTESTAISKDLIQDLESDKSSHPDIVTDQSSQLRKTATSESNNNSIASVTKIESSNKARRRSVTMSNPGLGSVSGIRNSTLFQLPQKIGINMSKSEPSSGNSSPTTPIKEKRNWFDKLKPRSNTKH